MDHDELVERSKRAVREIVARLGAAGGSPSSEQIREALQTALAADTTELGGLQAVVLDYVRQVEGRHEDLEDLEEIARLWSTGRLSAPVTWDGVDAYQRRQSVGHLLDQLRSDELELETRLAELPRSWAAVEALCEACRDAPPEPASLMAAVAVVIARELPQESAAPNLLAYAFAHQASAAFRGGNQALAARAFDEMRAAAVMVGDGPEWDDDLEGYCPVALALEASYLREVRRLPEALGLQATALTLLIGHRARAPRPRLLAALLIAAAQSLYEIGKSEQAVRILEASRSLESHLPERLYSALHHNLAVAHLDLGDTPACRRALRRLESHPRHSVEPTRILWTRARLLLAEGRPEGLDLLRRVRAEMAESGTAYDVGLVSLELAHHYAATGNLERARCLALESLPLFAAPGCDREILVAMGYLSASLSASVTSAALAETALAVVRAFLTCARWDASLRFERPA